MAVLFIKSFSNKVKFIKKLYTEFKLLETNSSDDNICVSETKIWIFNRLEDIKKF